MEKKQAAFSPHPRGETAPFVALDVCRPRKVALANKSFAFGKVREFPIFYPKPHAPAHVPAGKNIAWPA
jgi:hypothetical protein